MEYAHTGTAAAYVIFYKSLILRSDRPVCPDNITECAEQHVRFIKVACKDFRIDLHGDLAPTRRKCPLFPIAVIQTAQNRKDSPSAIGQKRPKTVFTQSQIPLRSSNASVSRSKMAWSLRCSRSQYECSAPTSTTILLPGLIITASRI